MAHPHAEPVHCGGCGGPVVAGDHERCARRLALDPPRFCSACGFRLDVQVYPDRVVSRCRKCRRRSRRFGLAGRGDDRRRRDENERRGEPIVSVMDVITDSRAIAILRAPDARRFVEIAHALVDGGLRCVEVTLTSRGALDAITELAGDLPDGVVLGAGTVLDADQADAAVDAGAAFLISPAVCPEVVAFAKDRGVPVMPGAATATEILDAWRAGAAAVKVFPASLLGGPAYLKALRGPLPDIPLVPTGGVDVDAAAAYLDAGAVAVGVGGPLLGDAAAGGDLDGLRERSRRLMQAVAGPDA